jgi:hypothetical protein
MMATHQRRQILHRANIEHAKQEDQFSIHSPVVRRGRIAMVLTARKRLVLP